MLRCWAAVAAAMLMVALASCAPSSAPVAEAPASGFAGPATQRVAAVETLAENLSAPWSVVALPAGGALVSQRDDGAVLEVGADRTARRVGVVPDVASGGEAGLNGLALWSGDGETWLYAYLATATENRVVRMPLIGAAGSHRLGAAQVVFGGIPRARTHDGGRIAFGPDQMLYIATGDAQRGMDAQDRNALNGKILRVTPHGEPAPGNPFGTAVYSYGHRNVQGLAWTADGTMWASEFGHNAWDELNVIAAGNNYGWPVVEGTGGDGRFRDPVAVWPPSEASPSGLAAVGETLYLAALRGERLWQLRVAHGQVVGEPAVALDGFGRLRDVLAATDGSLWVLTNNTDGRGSPHQGDDRLLRLRIAPAS